MDRILLVTFVYVICPPTTSLSSSSLRDLDSFDEFARQLMDCRRVPGLVVSVVDLRRQPSDGPADPRVVERQFGWADVEARRPMTTDTRVCLASLTKAFTSTLLGIMLRNTTRGESSAWDTPLAQLLPGNMAAFDDDWVTSHVTLRDVILHRTGVSRSFDELWLLKAYDRRDIVRIIRHMEASSNFRSESRYNNVVYSLVGHVTERLGADRSWESLLRELVLEPLNMTETSFFHARDKPDMFARPYLHPHGVASVWTQPPSLPRGISSVSSAVSLCSTPRDMSRWITALLSSASDSAERCEHVHCRVLPPPVVRETFRPQVIASRMIRSHVRRPHTDAPFYMDGYGLGWFTGHYRGWNTVLHYGSLVGAYSLLTLLPELRLGIFTSYNGAVQSDPYTINSLIHVHLIDLFLGVQPSVNATHWCSLLGTAQSRRADVDETPGSLRYPDSAYTGVYWQAVLGDFEVWDNGTGALKARYGPVEVRLRPLQSGTEFLGTPTDAAWLMLLGNLHLAFSAVDGDQRCRRVSVSLLSITAFERRDVVHSAAVRPRENESAALSATAVTSGLITLLLQHHASQ